MPAPLDPKVKAKIASLRSEGYSRVETAAKVGCSVSTIKKMELGHDGSGKSWREARYAAKITGPVPYAKLSPEAKRAWDDIGYFALRYFGAILKPWHIEATQKIVALMETDREEYAVINCPPGSGKSFFFGRILPAWFTVRRRDIRGMIVSNAQANANKELMALRRMFEEPLPVRASSADIRLGIAVDAEASLVHDFGLFRPPTDGEQWAQNAFQVMPQEGFTVGEKEPTWQAYGQGGRFLGNRLDLVICDDAYDKSAIKTSEARQNIKDWYDSTVETRLEPNGLLLLIGQRQHADDLYRHALDKVDAVDEDGDEVEDVENAPRQYHQVIFKAHYDDLCTGEHKDVSAYPEGCLLYPERIKWRKLAGLIARGSSTFAVEYQQEDISTTDVLVDPMWVKGGKDPKTHIEYMGCLDDIRGEWELPVGMDRTGFIWASADPSPTKYWSIQCWFYHPDTEQRFLLAHHRARMDAPDLLDYNVTSGEYTGVMEEWRIISERMGLPIKNWIVESNAAQRFLLQYNYATMWKIKHGVFITRHETHTNKSDPNLGIQSLKSIWREGKVRLPNRPGDMGRLGTKKLVDEVTRWPEGTTDDAVMAHWFGEWNLNRLYTPAMSEDYQFTTPTWITRQPGIRSA